MEQTAKTKTVVPLYKDKSVLIIGDMEEGKKILTTKDDYISGWSSFEKHAKLEDDSMREITFEDIMKYQADQVRPFPAEDVERTIKLAEKVKNRLDKFDNIHLPPIVYINLTTGKEESSAAYCRGLNGIFMPPGMSLIGSSVSTKEYLMFFVHELWHIISRNTPNKLRNACYRVLGFEPFQEIEEKTEDGSVIVKNWRLPFPEQLAEYKISNPDAVFLEHYVPLEADGVCVLPIIFSSSSFYSKLIAVSFFGYLVLKLLCVEKSENGSWSVVTDESYPFGVKLLNVNEVSPEFNQKLGGNTQYIFHPEETCADNFKLLFAEAYKGKANSPSHLLKLGEVLGYHLTEEEKELFHK